MPKSFELNFETVSQQLGLYHSLKVNQNANKNV